MCSEKVTHSHCQADHDIWTVASRHICTCMGQDLWKIGWRSNCHASWTQKQQMACRGFDHQSLSNLSKRKKTCFFLLCWNTTIRYFNSAEGQMLSGCKDSKDLQSTYREHSQTRQRLQHGFYSWQTVACMPLWFFALKPGVSDAASFSWANRCWKNGGLSLTHAVVFVVVWHLHANRQHM